MLGTRDQSNSFDLKIAVGVRNFENNRLAWCVVPEIVVLGQPQQDVVAGDGVGHGQAPRTSTGLVVQLTLPM